MPPRVDPTSDCDVASGDRFLLAPGRGLEPAPCEVTVLQSIEFVHQGRRYQAHVAPVPGGGPEFADGAWFVSMNGGAARRVFEAHREDADTPEFRHRMMIATWLTEGYNRRVSGERRRAGKRESAVVERRNTGERRM